MKQVVVDSEDVKNILVEAFRDRLKNDYSSPARDVVNRVFQEVAPDFETILREVLTEVVKDKDFKQAVKDEFRHKVAKLLVGDLSGSVEKAVNSFRQDSTLKARMILAIENIIAEPPLKQE